MPSRLLFPLALAAAISLTACGTTRATSTTSSTSPADRAALLAKVEQFDRSIREGDKQGYGDVFVEDFVFTWSVNGQLYDRETILPNVVPTPDYAPLVDEQIVRAYGDAAVVNFRVRKDEDTPGARVTFSCVRIDGEWKVMASHSTKIVPPESEGAGDGDDDGGDGNDDGDDDGDEDGER